MIKATYVLKEGEEALQLILFSVMSKFKSLAAKTSGQGFLALQLSLRRTFVVINGINNS